MASLRWLFIVYLCLLHNLEQCTAQSNTTEAVTTDLETTTLDDKIENINKVPNDVVSGNFSLKFTDDDYNEKLANKSSPEYENKTEVYKHKITQYFVDVKGFQNITNIVFRKGSLIADVVANFNYYKTNSDTDYLRKELLMKVLPKLRSDNSTNNSYTVNSFFQTIEKFDVCSLYSCNQGYDCKYEASGRLKCAKKTFTHCNLNCDNGDCVFDSDFTPKCKCTENDKEVFVGETCDVRVERLALKTNYIIAIAAGGGGGIIFILIIVIVIICVMKDKKRNKDSAVDVKDAGSEDSFPSIQKDLEDGLRQTYKNPEMREPSFRRSDKNMTVHKPSPYTISEAPAVPQGRPQHDIRGNMTSEYQYNGLRNQADNVEMRRPSRVRVMDDIENSPDYTRRESRPRDSIDASYFRKNSNFGLQQQRRRSSAFTDFKSNVTRNPFFGASQNRRKSSVFSEIDDNYSKSTMYQPDYNNDLPLRSAANGRAMDYNRRKDSVGNPFVRRPSSMGDIYDYADDSNRMQFGSRRPQPFPSRRY